MDRLRFEFAEEKLVQAIAFFSASGVPGLTKLKLAKLLYFADKAHLNRFGRPVTGDLYVCMSLGPVPSISLNEMNSALDMEVEAGSVKVPTLLATLEVDRAGRYPEFRLRAGAQVDETVFSRSDVIVLRDTVTRYGAKTASQLVDESHFESAWRKADTMRAPHSSSSIPFEDLFEVENLPLLEEALFGQQEDAELEQFLRSRKTEAQVNILA